MSKADAKTPAGRPFRVLVIHPDAGVASSLVQGLEKAPGPFEVGVRPEVEDALASLARAPVHAALLALPDGDLEPLVRLVAEAPGLPVAVLGPAGDADLPLRALRLGAQEWIDAPVAPGPGGTETLVRALRQALVRQRLRRSDADPAATRDPVTGQANRLRLMEILGRCLGREESGEARLGVVVLDLDRFKHVNDTLGNRVGDELLRQTARRLARSVRRGDVVARTGDDEFVVVLPGVDHDHELAKLAEKLLANVAEPVVLEGREYWLTASIGIAVGPRDGRDADALLRHAQTAMVQAKRGGGDAFRFYCEPMNAAARRRLVLERRLRKAFAENLLVIQYQPRVEMRTGRVVGAEALMRWHDEELGTIEPWEFISVAEDAGLMGEIGRYTLVAACAQGAAWKQQGFRGVRMSVNVAPSEVREEVLRETVVRTLWDTGLEPGDLELEITEGTLMRPESVAVLQELKRIGVGVSLDDFGTGFSSLSHLKQIPIDTVKIDRSFVADLTSDPDDEAIVSAILSLAGKLGLRVVAEGVETPEQRDFLAARGCDEMQGFLLAPALPAEDFVALLRDGLG